MFVAERLPTAAMRFQATALTWREQALKDCGLGGRVHADLACAKLRTLVEGARLASTSLWP